MGKVLDKAVSVGPEGYDFQCPGVKGSLCGDLAVGGKPFVSTGWPTKKAALARGEQHFAEHRGDGPMQMLEDFRADQGLAVNAKGQAVDLGDL